MVFLAILGAVLGVLAAYLATLSRRNFRQRLLADLDTPAQRGNPSRYVSNLLRYRANWLRSISFIRKPFTKQVNLAIETMALLVTILALINSIENFDKVFSSMTQGVSIVIFLGLLLAYIPSEWLFTERIDKEVSAVLDEMEEALDAGKLDAYLERAKSSWK